MYELSQILLWILWRLRPAMAVETNLVDIIAAGFATFEDEATREWMDEDPANCARISAGLLDAHSKLDLLIHLRACEIAGIAHNTRPWRPTILPHHSDRTAAACYRRFVLLVQRFHEAERLAQLRAIRLRRDCDEALPACFAAPAHAVVVSHIAPHVEVLHRLRRGRWIGASSRRDGGGRASARGPPLNPLRFPVNSPSRRSPRERPLMPKTNRPGFRRAVVIPGPATR